MPSRPEPPKFIEPLGSQHDRGAFSCGEDLLDRYLKEQAIQDLKRRAAAVFVAHQGNGIVVGYYTLSSLSVNLNHLAQRLAKKLPCYPLVPATLLGRLAVDRTEQGKGFGEFLLFDALRRGLEQTKHVGSSLVVVDALHTQAREFYQRYGFILYPDHVLRLFLPVATIAKSV